MPLKIFYLTTEITPFAQTSMLANYSARVPLILQEKEHDIRTMLPKYGFVSERKYILREVIRLREIPFEFDGQDRLTSAKSAFIPKTRVQVYFLEDVKWFKPLSNLLYKSKNGRILSDNDERYAYFGKAALATLPHLFWSPDLIVCNGWQSSIVPIIYKQQYTDKEFYKNIKTTLVVFAIDEYAEFGRDAYYKAGVELPDAIKGDTVNAYDVAAHFADQIIVHNTPGRNNLELLLKSKHIKDHEDKIISVDWDDDESPDYRLIAETLDDSFQKLFD